MEFVLGFAVALALVVIVGGVALFLFARHVVDKEAVLKPPAPPALLPADLQQWMEDMRADAQAVIDKANALPQKIETYKDAAVAAAEASQTAAAQAAEADTAESIQGISDALDAATPAAPQG